MSINFKKGDLWIALFLIVGTVFSLLVSPGYRVLTSDQKIYIPSVYQKIDPSLFNKDILLSFQQSNYSLFNEIIIFLMNTLRLNIFILFFILTILFRFIFFYSIYKIAFYFTKNKWFSLFSPLLFLGTSLRLYGTAIRIIDLELVPRAISLPLCFLFLALYLNKKIFLSTFPLCLGLILNPIVTIPFILFYYTDIFILSHKDKILSKSKKILFGFIPFIWLALLLMFAQHPKINIFGLINLGWEQILRFRTPFLFITEWNLLDFAFLLISLAMYLIPCSDLTKVFKREDSKKRIYLLVCISLILFVMSIILVDILRSSYFVQFQMSRGLIFLKIFSILFFSYYTFLFIKNNPKNKLYSFLLISSLISVVLSQKVLLIFFPLVLLIWINQRFQIYNILSLDSKTYEKILYIISVLWAIDLMFIFLRGEISSFVKISLVSLTILLYINYKPFNLKIGMKEISIFCILLMIALSMPNIHSFSIMPGYYNDSSFLDACNWIKEKTNKDAVFITEPFADISAPFRIECKRNVYFSYKDGAQITFSESYALEWYRRFKIIEEITNNTRNTSHLLEKENVNYIFSEKNRGLGLTEIYSNEKYRIYELNKLQ